MDRGERWREGEVKGRSGVKGSMGEVEGELEGEGRWREGEEEGGKGEMDGGKRLREGKAEGGRCEVMERWGVRGGGVERCREGRGGGRERWRAGRDGGRER